MKRKIFCLAAFLSLLAIGYTAYSQSCIQGPYGTQTFNGALDNASSWAIDFPSNPALTFVTDGYLGKAMRLTQCASSSASSHCSPSTSSFGQMGGVTTGINVHAGYVCGSGTNPSADCRPNSDGVGQVEETWYRFHVRLAPGYLPTPGTQNSLIEWHVDQRTEADAVAHSSFAYSPLMGVRSDSSASCSGSPSFCTSSGANPNLFFQIPGGSNTTNAQPKRFFPLAANSLLINHWYDLVWHMVWSPLTTGTTPGKVQIWLDGVKLIDALTPTQYLRTDGTYSYQTGFGGYNYRLWVNWVSSTDFDEFVWGPTAQSINFAGQ